MKKLFIIAAILTATVNVANSTLQVAKPVKWKITYKKVSEKVYDIICKATIEKGWYLYDSELPDGGPQPTTFNVDTRASRNVELAGKFKATSGPLTEYSQAFKMELKYFKDTVTFVQRVTQTKAPAKLTGYVEFMACSGGQCIPPAEVEFEFTFKK